MKWRDVVGNPNAIAIDTETTGLYCDGHPEDRDGVWPARPFVVVWCDYEGNSTYVRFPIDPKTRRVKFEKCPNKFAKVQRMLADPETVKVFHNANFDVRMLEVSGWSIAGKIVDTKNMAHVASRASFPIYRLKWLCKRLFDFPDDDEADLKESAIHARYAAEAKGWAIAEKDRDGGTAFAADYWMADRELCKKYAIGDVERTMMLYRFFSDILEDEPKLAKVFIRECKLFQGPIREMERVGMRTFPKDIRRLRRFYEDYVTVHKQLLTEFGYGELKTRSPIQKHQVFVVDRGLKPFRKTPKGKPKLDGEFMKHYANPWVDEDGNLHEPDVIARAALEINNASYALANFVYQYDRMRVKEAPGVWVLHPHVRQTGAKTGRMSCSEPNLMNPAAEDTGRRKSEVPMLPRETLGPRPGMIWYLPDYSQIEVWLFAYLSNNEVMIDALRSGLDFHGSVATKVWGDLPDFQERYKYYRKSAKMFMFLKLYGGGIDKLAALLYSDRETAIKHNASYEDRVPGLKPFMRRMSNRARRDGYVENPFGRKVEVPRDKPYKATNYVIQGTAAEVLKDATYNVWRMKVKKWPEANILMDLHDEIIIELPLSYHCAEFRKDVIREMQRAADPLGLPVKLPVGIKLCRRRWAKTEEVPLDSES